MSDDEVIALARLDPIAMLFGSGVTKCERCGAECSISKSGVEYLRKKPTIKLVCIECVSERADDIEDVMLVPGAAEELSKWIKQEKAKL